MRSRSRQHLVVLLACSAVGVLTCVICGGVVAAAACRHYASPDGSDRWRGTAEKPFRTAQKLIDSLHRGQTGCLRPGVYRQDVVFRRGGRRGAPITLTSAAGGPAEVVGRMWITRSANYVHVTRLRLDGRNPGLLPSPTIDSTGDSFIHDDVTNDHTAICFELGSSVGYGRAAATLLQHNRIHDCGILPATNADHGVYVGNSIGAQILDNLIYNNADRGIQLYWNAQYTTVAGNIIDRNGEGVMIAGDAVSSSSHNLIANNIITNSAVRADIESWWPGSRKGSGNLVVDNCVNGGRRTIDRSAGGFVSRGNIVTNPLYRRTAASGYALVPLSRCGLMLALAATAGKRYSGLMRSVAVRAGHR